MDRGEIIGTSLGDDRVYDPVRRPDLAFGLAAGILHVHILRDVFPYLCVHGLACACGLAHACMVFWQLCTYASLCLLLWQGHMDGAACQAAGGNP